MVSLAKELKEVGLDGFSVMHITSSRVLLMFTSDEFGHEMERIEACMEIQVEGKSFSVYVVEFESMSEQKLRSNCEDYDSEQSKDKNMQESPQKLMGGIGSQGVIETSSLSKL
ncbi:hypothetical protein V6N13_018932 [Hibiscus sabdariffa]|uniref:Uncharacterized protein n=1 Tax=Hibiscus sabdariffa TaxID=183260 RepID=A0ABR2EKF7_9ROSI